MSTLAEIHYTVEVPRRGAIRKTKTVRASAEGLPAAVQRAQAKLEDVGAYQIVVRYEVAS
jgi:hypothetical protein